MTNQRVATRAIRSSAFETRAETFRRCAQATRQGKNENGGRQAAVKTHVALFGLRLRACERARSAATPSVQRYSDEERRSAPHA